jgi:phosphate-selective porin OprO/OprP
LPRHWRFTFPARFPRQRSAFGHEIRPLFTAQFYRAALTAVVAVCALTCAAIAQEALPTGQTQSPGAYNGSLFSDSKGAGVAAKDDVHAQLDRQEEELHRLRLEIDDMRTGKLGVSGSDSTANLVPVAPSADSRKEDVPSPTQSKKDANSFPADSKSPLSSGYEVGSDKALITTWNNGFEARSKNGDFRFHPGGLIQFDSSFLNTERDLLVPPAAGGIGSNPDSMQLRRARICLEGTAYEVFDFKFEWDFANFVAPAAPSAGQPVVSTPGMTEVWVQMTQIPYLGIVRVGNQKEPLGLEHVESIRSLSFIEPSYLFDLVFGPFNLGFSPGVQVLNWSDDQETTWQYGVFGNDSDGFGYSLNNDYAFTGRATHLLWYDEPSNGRYLWEVGVSGSARTPDEDAVRLRTRGDIRSGPPGVLNPIYADTGGLLSSQQDVLAFETFAQAGPWSLQGEYAGTWIQDATQPARVDRGTPFFHGGYIELLYYLTGDSRTFNKQLAIPDRTVPLENGFLVKSCNGCNGGLGAWQLGIRYSAVDLNDNGINGGILNSETLGLNWFPNPNTIVQFNYDLTHRSQVLNTPDGFINGFGARMAFSF